MHKTLTKYNILRIRQKISYIAFSKNMTVSELILYQVLKTHNKFVKEGWIPLYDGKLEEKQKIFMDLLAEDKTMFAGVMRINSMCSGHHKGDSKC